nr:hypothetical protein [Candidatus Pantoea persica]
MLDADYNKYMDIQQEINLQLMAALEERDIRFASPICQMELSGGRIQVKGISPARKDSIKHPCASARDILVAGRFALRAKRPFPLAMVRLFISFVIVNSHVGLFRRLINPTRG